MQLELGQGAVQEHKALTPSHLAPPQTRTRGQNPFLTSGQYHNLYVWHSRAFRLFVCFHPCIDLFVLRLIAGV